MQYMFLVYTNEKAFQTMASTQREQAMGAYIAYTESLRRGHRLERFLVGVNEEHVLHCRLQALVSRAGTIAPPTL